MRQQIIDLQQPAAQLTTTPAITPTLVSTSTQQPKQQQKQQTLPLFNKPKKYQSYQQKIQQKIQKVFKNFTFNSITFQLFLINCIIWLSVHIIYYWGINPRVQWDCIQYYFFAKYQPSISYNYQFWRLLLSSFMFRGWIQFYFNNFALNMLGYVIEKESRIRFLVIFYGGILAGHMLSCCLSYPGQLTVGTSCGTIALLPIQVRRYLRLRKTNPLQAKPRRNFLIYNILSNFILNVLAIFKLQPVDWVSHVGCIFAGVFFMIYYEMKKIQGKPEDVRKISPKTAKILKKCSKIILILFYIVMTIVIWFYLPAQDIGRYQLDQINFLCNKNI